METSDVTFDETVLCPSSSFERAGDHEDGEPLFDDEEEGVKGIDDPGLPPPALPIGSISTTTAHGPDPSSSTTWGPCDPPPRAVPLVPEEASTAVEGEVTSPREAPRHIQRQHPPQ